jgi:caffeoyl-CoA O-methyltransferase
MKELAVTPDLHAYLRAHTTPADLVLAELLEASRAEVGDLQGMLITAEQGLLLTMLTALARAQRVLEIGTFTGASALCLARGLAPGGTLVCLEAEPRWPEVGRPFWRRAGVEDRIDLRIGDAHETVRQLPEDPVLDLAFVDADKTGYADYVAEVLPRLRPGGLLLVDNVLWGGAVLEQPPASDGTRAIQEVNAALAADPEVEVVLLPVADGIAVARRRLTPR